MSEDVADERLAAIEAATRLADLTDVFDTDSPDEAYFLAKGYWREAIGRSQPGDRGGEGLPGSSVTVDGHTYHVHGITHADTDSERAFVRSQVADVLERGGAVHCEQGVRSMYFEGMEAVCEMDDYNWAMARSDGRETDEAALEDVLDDIDDLGDAIRDLTFSLIESGGAFYGGRFERALGDLAANFLTDPTDLAVGKDFRAFSLSRAASEDPSRLGELQRYYERTFLPQPLEREWLRRQDPRLELVSHARNERMADWAVYHADEAAHLHLVVGAAHQPGVTYYLRQYQDGRTLPTPFTIR